MSSGAGAWPRIAVIDYGMGNRRSVEKALEQAGARASITRDHDELRAADGLVLPGVGAFPLAMHNLRELGLAELIRERAGHGTPLLGICLGMQLLFDGSEELEPTAGLGLLAGDVTRLRTGGLRVPHIGWNEVDFERPSRLTDGLPEAAARSTTCTRLRRGRRRQPISWGRPNTASGSRRSSSAARVRRAVPSREVLGRRPEAA